MQKNITLIILVAVTTLLVACSDRAKDTHPQQLVTKRVAIFKQFTKALEPMGLVARDRQSYIKADFMAQAQALQTLSTQPWAYFTADGNYPPTRTKPVAWVDGSGFKQAQDSYLATVDHLVKVSGSADMPSIRDAVNAVQKSCKSCHDKFRNDTPGGQ